MIQKKKKAGPGESHSRVASASEFSAPSTPCLSYAQVPNDCGPYGRWGLHKAGLAHDMFAWPPTFVIHPTSDGPPSPPPHGELPSVAATPQGTAPSPDSHVRVVLNTGHKDEEYTNKQMDQLGFRT